MVQKAIEYRKPIAINISIGNTYGGHSGTSLLETYIDDISNYGRTVKMCIRDSDIDTTFIENSSRGGSNIDVG